MALRSPSSGLSCLTVMGGCLQALSAADQVHSLSYRMPFIKLVVSVQVLGHVLRRERNAAIAVLQGTPVSQGTQSHSLLSVWTQVKVYLRREHDFLSCRRTIGCVRFLACPYLNHTKATGCIASRS